ncbi:hypothetical protein PHJA_001125400 [Phtheirospermum japonicum]|uniref:Uncharacterized protein n=1 Tax=Phtheirospermum japonicum TaxID=374723 RepID=A0A830BSM2_9LAMI|nr:hypothetical protein PHJA_001125400 [Phtheirospermum japonicum]
MGCSGSKAEHLPLVVRCRERRDLIRAAANHRYALASAHVSYFRSLKDVGDALRKFVDEELITAESSSSSFSSPSLTLPRNSKQKHDNADESPLHLHDDDDDDDDESHLHLSDSSSEDGDSEDYAHHHHRHGHESEDDTHQHHSKHHHGRESEDDTHQHHHNKHHNNHHGHVHKGKKGFVDDDVSHLHSEEQSSSDYHPRGGFHEFGGGFSGFGDDPYMNPHQYPNPYQDPHRPYGEPYMDQWGPQGMAAAQPWYYSNNTNVHYMKKAAPVAHTVIQEPPADPSYGYSDSYYNPEAGYGHPRHFGNYGYVSNEGVRVNQKKEAPPPPSPPKESAWDFFNPFDGLNNNEYYSSGRYRYGSNSSSPDSTEVREREGIPDLEEETESEVYKEALKGKKVKIEAKKAYNNYNSEDSSSRKLPMNKNGSKSKQVPMHKSESSSKSLPSWSSEENEKPYNGADNAKRTSMPSQYSDKSAKPSVSSPHGEGTSWVVESPSGEMDSSMSLMDESSSPENIVVENTVKRKGVSFEVEEASRQDGDSSKLSSVTVSSPRGTRDLKEVVAEIRDEFETAASYGKEVAMMLEVGKLPYQPSFLKVILSQILYPIYPSLSSRDPPSMQSAKLASKTMKLAKSYFDDVGKDENSQACNLSSTLDKLYAWEKKLYKEVKDEEKLRIMYEKQCKKLKYLDQEGAESSKIDAARASIRRLLTKLDVSVKAIDAISIRINKLRDEELQPQVAELIHGLIRMWKAMLKCHQKQFQAVMESKMRRLKANTSLQTDPTLRATTELERELRAWCERFNEWIAFQKSYAESLNDWLLHCLQYESEETPDGPVPYSPGHLGAPPIFVICNDWHQAMKAVSEARVANAMNTFAMSLRQLWEKQDEEGRQRLKAEYLSKDYEKQLRQQHTEGKGKTGLSVVPTDHSGVSRLDDLKVDLDSMRQKLTEERVKHKDAMKLVHDAASSSLQGGLVPIFKALEVFTSEALKAHEHVRIYFNGGGVLVAEEQHRSIEFLGQSFGPDYADLLLTELSNR